MPNLELSIDRMGHGGVGIGTADDGRVVFVASAYPGDRVKIDITKEKKSFVTGEILEVITPSKYRGKPTCQAAAAGAGCCDFATLDTTQETELKRSVFLDQLARIGKFSEIELPELNAVELAPVRGWRTRVRFGVDENGKAGLRKRHSHELVTQYPCSQLVDGLSEGIVGTGARRFRPGAELIVAIDSTGQRHVVESRKTGRGKRVEKVERVLEGSGEVTEIVDGQTFRFPVTAFWQAHRAAPQAYSAIIEEWLADPGQPAGKIGWDLYGGVGLFIPAIARALNPESPTDSVLHSVDTSSAALENTQPALQGLNVSMHKQHVEKAVAQLAAPDCVVLDPPRKGAGAAVIDEIAAADPKTVVHIGCDPATCARDLRSWSDNGYRVDKLTLINAFPGTHHFELMALLRKSA